MRAYILDHIANVPFWGRMFGAISGREFDGEESRNKNLHRRISGYD
jgi:hypothetical protein